MMKKSLLFMLFAALFMPLAVHAQQSLPYSCGFEEDEDLSGWLFYGVTSDQTGILYGEDYAHDGIRFFAFNYSEENAYLVSPIFTGGDNGIDGSFEYDEQIIADGVEEYKRQLMGGETKATPLLYLHVNESERAIYHWKIKKEV